MVGYVIKNELSVDEKIELMREDACFDVSDNDEFCVPDLDAIRSEFKSGGSLPKVPKVMMSNECTFNCAYCGCRAGNERRKRYTNAPGELAKLSVDRAIENKRGIFITSAIYRNADYTTELIVETLKCIRDEHGYKGYIHAKIMPGTDAELIRQAGFYANRLSVNIEVAKSEGYDKIAKNKTKENILTPMHRISSLIKATQGDKGRFAPHFATSQTTQLMAGSTDESDYEILRLSQAMYSKYDLKRVYYTPYKYEIPAVGYEDLDFASTPSWRMKRLYQADRLMQLYGFTPEEITPGDAADLVSDLDPKAAWALRNIDIYPIEVNKADFEQLLRIPGIGMIYAARIVKARKYCKITPDVLKALGVALKRSKHFMTCDGKFIGEKCETVEAYRNLLVSPLSDSDDVLSFAGSVEDCC